MTQTPTDSSLLLFSLVSITPDLMFSKGWLYDESRVRCYLCSSDSHLGAIDQTMSGSPNDCVKMDSHLNGK